MWENEYVDLHVHSYYSDGSMAPGKIVSTAFENGVKVLAIADHNVVEGSLQIRGLCEKVGIRYIPAVEIDALEAETNFHILAYGFDVNNHEFIRFLAHMRFLLDELSVKLIEAMQSDYQSISLDDYMDFTYDRHLGGWKALHYFLEKGITSQLKQGIPLYAKYHISYSRSGYPSIHSVCYRIKKAGGYAVLAHPGEQLDTSDIGSFSSSLRQLVSLGLDGIECRYPTHSEAVTLACLKICSEKDLLITTGSDCHGVFGKTQIGEMKIPLSKVSLKELLCEKR